jgi:beta-1,4-mannooligosaccharide/beta-1,4-mannosyl-N-acetylglucosamine phosphorylase
MDGPVGVPGREERVSVLTRSERNPIITRSDIPDIPPQIADATSVFNPGAAKLGGRYLLMLRVQTRSRETFLLIAESEDGESFDIRHEVIGLAGIEQIMGTAFHVYDPRITEIEGTFHIMVAIDTEFGCRLGVATTTDFESFEFRGLAAKNDIRNGVLFPEKRIGRYLRLDRPNKVRLADGPTTGDAIYLSESEDLLDWYPVARVMTGRAHYWDELIGSGPPPIKTRDGWLHVYHGVATHFRGANIYQAGAVLLDLADPSQVVARTRGNILEPREPYELVGQVPNVVFPSGMIVDEYDEEGYARPGSRVLLYYGAADTCVGLATTTVGELIAACRE